MENPRFLFFLGIIGGGRTALGKRGDIGNLADCPRGDRRWGHLTVAARSRNGRNTVARGRRWRRRRLRRLRRAVPTGDVRDSLPAAMQRTGTQRLRPRDEVLVSRLRARRRG